MHAPGTRRAIVAVLACELVPVPLLDTWCQNQVRRAWVDWHAERYGVRVEVAPERIWSRPFKAVAKKVFPPLVLWELYTLIRDTRALGAQLAAPVTTVGPG